MSAASSEPVLDADACYRAVTARDARFDGLFFVGVTTTGIYCRPVCPARTPGRLRCVFFRSAALAEREGFRACFRCRPEIAPGRSRVDAVSAVVAGAVARIDEGALNEGSLDDLARELGVTGRHLRRAVHEELGVSPIELAQSRRLGLAKQLLQDTGLTMTEVALSSGFASIRRFNASFQTRFGRSPTEVRRASASSRGGREGAFVVTLGYRPPLDWPALLGFLRPRAIPGVEHVGDAEYSRTVAVGAHAGTVAVRADPEKNVLRAELSVTLAPALPAIVARLRHLFDVDARPALVAAHLRVDRALAPLVARRPGLRVPGAFDPFEVCVRAVLGQQVSVAAATTLAGRLASSFGTAHASPGSPLRHVFPTASRLARASERELAAIGLTSARAASLAALARGVASGAVRVDRGVDVAGTMIELQRLPGVGPWTASYVAMRALGSPDAFPEGDLGLRRALGDVSAREVFARAERWRPWRAYAAMHLWTSLTSQGADA